MLRLVLAWASAGMFGHPSAGFPSHSPFPPSAPPKPPTRLSAAAGVESSAADAKENRQQAGNAVPALPHPGGRSRRSGHSSNFEKGKRLSPQAAVSKTRRKARPSETRISSSSAEQDSVQGAAALGPDQSVEQFPTAQVAVTHATSSSAQPAIQDPHDRDSIAESTVSQASALAEAAARESPAVTPVKAPGAAKASGDVCAGVPFCTLEPDKL